MSEAQRQKINQDIVILIDRFKTRPTKTRATAKILELIQSQEEYKRFEKSMKSEIQQMIGQDESFAIPKNFKWKRDSKFKLDLLVTANKSDYGKWEKEQGTFSIEKDGFSYGFESPELIKASYQDWVNSGHKKKFLPTVRYFIPVLEEIQDTFTLRVYTTHDDTEIMMWEGNVD